LSRFARISASLKTLPVIAVDISLLRYVSM
jgi:hypothetical protein